MVKFSFSSKFTDFFLRKYKNSDYVLKQNVIVILTLSITLFLGTVIFIISYYIMSVNDSSIILTPIILSIILISLIFILRMGYYTIVAHSLLTFSLLATWGTMFLDKGPILQRLDTIVLIIALLTLIPLVIRKHKHGITLYYFANTLIAVIFSIYMQYQLTIDKMVIFEYLVDILAALTFTGYISYKIFHSNKEALNKAGEAEDEIQSQYRELISINHELSKTHDKLLKLNKTYAQEKERLSTTLRSIGEGVITIDIDGHVELINRIAEDITGWTFAEAKNQPAAKILALVNEMTGETSENLVARVLTSGEIIHMRRNTILICKDKSKKVMSTIGAPILDDKGLIIGAVLVFRDITERKKMESELNKSSKIESLGVFAGGIAHDFNNLLTAIMGNISIAKLNMKDGDDNYAILSEAEKASIRAKNLTNQLLTFSKGGMPVKKITSIQDLLKDICDFVLSGSNIKCNYSISGDLWNTEIDEGQISQVIHNIVLNSRQAMPGGGTIKVESENIKIDSSNKFGLLEGRYILIEISDKGHGIAKENLQNIFDPYFTTKETGSGLGLSVSYSIIKKHNGHITVISELNKGTIFKIYLPASKEKVVSEENKKNHDSFKSGRILLMDDDEKVLDVCKKMLVRLEFEVECAFNGEEAIKTYKHYKEQGNPFQLVIMDLTIPGKMSGEEAIQILKDYDPHIKAIVSSGYSNDPVMANYKDYGFIGVIAKPYMFDELKEVLQKVLN